MEGLMEAMKTIDEGGKVITQNQVCFAALVTNLSLQGIPFYQVVKVINGQPFYGVSAQNVE